MTQANILIEDIQGSTPEKIMKIAHISGQLDESNIDEKIQEIYKVVEANPKALNMVFDLENLEYMNSKSIGYITDLYGKITDSAGQVVIINARPNILDILNVVGLTQLIKSFSTLEEAKTHIISASPTMPIMPPTSVAETPATPVEPISASIAAPTAPIIDASTQMPTASPEPVSAPAAPTEQPTTATVSAPTETIMTTTPTPVATTEPITATPTEPASAPAPEPEPTNMATPEIAVNAPPTNPTQQ